jgi:HSP20 family molecular chaperone IbpA
MTETNTDIVQCDTKPDLEPVAPRYRVRQEQGLTVLEVDLPGVPPAQVALELEGRALALRATPRELTESGDALRIEFDSAPFAQTWRLPNNLDLEALTTRFEHGVLTIQLPDRVPKRRSIPIVQS